MMTEIQPALFPAKTLAGDRSTSDPSVPASPSFDANASEAAKEAGMELAAENKPQLLAFARKLALEIGKRKSTVTADDVQAALQGYGVSIKALGNAAGSLFKDGNWIWTGRFEKSKRIHAHSNMLRVWTRKI
jgi:hypothetical protein